jgi:hypothetical protein
MHVPNSSSFRAFTIVHVCLSRPGHMPSEHINAMITGYEGVNEARCGKT